MSEYGITVRWDKNFLTMVQLMLSRRKRFRAYGGVRFGGTLTIEDAWDFGFDHIAIATGAGRPTIVPMKNNLIRGIRQASDFLMALQLTGAFKKDTLSNLQVRLPAVVIGGGLTGIDTATELFAYYPIQCEKMLDKYEQVVAEFGEEAVVEKFDEEEISRSARNFSSTAARSATSVPVRQTPARSRISFRWFAAGAAFRSSIANACRTRRPTASITRRCKRRLRKASISSSA